MENEFYKNLRNSGKPLSPEEIEEASKDTYTQIPECWQKMLLRVNGGNFDGCGGQFCFSHKHENYGITISFVCRIEKGHFEDFRTHVTNVLDILEEVEELQNLDLGKNVLHYLPIMHCWGEHYFVINSSNGKIYFLQGFDGGPEMIEASATLSDFLDKITFVGL